MTDKVNWVLLGEFGSEFEAELLRGALEAEGVPCKADTAGAADEFTMARHLMGLGVGLYVEPHREVEARAILAALRARAAAMDDEAPSDGDEDATEA